MRIRRGIAAGHSRSAASALALGGEVLCAALLVGCAAGAEPSADTAADIDRTVLENLDLAWHGVDARTERPTTGTPRWVLPNGWGFTVARCMNGAGYDLFEYSRIEGFLVAGQSPSGNGEQALALYDCLKAYPIYSTVYATPDEAQLTELYDYYESFLVPCLQSSGARLSAVPDEVAFRSEGEGEGAAGSWNPYLAIARPDSVALVERLFEKCPAYPG